MLLLVKTVASRLMTTVKALTNQPPTVMYYFVNDYSCMCMISPISSSTAVFV